MAKKRTSHGPQYKPRSPWRRCATSKGSTGPAAIYLIPDGSCLACKGAAIQADYANRNNACLSLRAEAEIVKCSSRETRFRSLRLVHLSCRPTKIALRRPQPSA